MALTICEDAWNDKHFWNKRLYTVDPVESLVQAGGNFVLNISASPFWMGKRELRREMLATIARHDKVPVLMVNQVGGNDSLIFDGSSLVLNDAGEVIAQGKSFEEDLIYFDSDELTGEMHQQIPGEEASAYAALVLGTRDYVRKCGFQRVIIGLSGGIDSALTACIASDAVGPENVIGVGMPGPYSSSARLTTPGCWPAISASDSSCSALPTSSRVTERLCKKFSPAARKTRRKKTYRPALAALY